MLKNPPAGLVLRPENFFRRKKREITFYLSTTFRLHVMHFFFCLILIAFHLALSYAPLMERFEYVFLDFFFRQRPLLTTSPVIAYIEMAEDSLQTIGRWPWPRHNHAAVAHILNEWGAKAIVFDVIFSEPSTSFDDAALAEAISKSDNIYMPVVLEAHGNRKVWIHSLPELERKAKGLGHVNIFPDMDGTIRRVMPYIHYGSETYPYLALRVAYDYLQKDLPPPNQLPFPTDEKKRMFINWAGKWKETFEHFSYLDIIRSFAAIKAGRQPIISPEEIRGKICIIGLTAAGLTDIKACPLEEAYPAVGVQANIMNSILTNQFAYPAPRRWNQFALLIVGVIATFLFIFSRRTVSFIAGLALGVIWVSTTFLFFVKQGIWLTVMNPLLLIVSLFAFSAVFSITVGRKEQRRLMELATRDGLTGLFVIRHFRTLLNDAVEEAHKKELPLALILLDLDHFKNINDTYGHQAGDAVLKYVAQTLQTHIKNQSGNAEQNPIGRYGGEEFVIMLKSCHLVDAAFNYAEPIRKAFEQGEFHYEGIKIPVTISIGVAGLHPGETVPDLMVYRADEALYRAKAEGRNRSCIEKESAG